jgi:hypothetical protein
MRVNFTKSRRMAAVLCAVPVLMLAGAGAASAASTTASAPQVTTVSTVQSDHCGYWGGCYGGYGYGYGYNHGWYGYGWGPGFFFGNSWYR